ncbi:MAG: hypothetical protein L3J02_06925 [Henriciella sp.]|nr:hypothetical protein [Henriciella sp.]
MSGFLVSCAVISDPECRFKELKPSKTAINQTYTPDYSGMAFTKPNRINSQSLGIRAISTEIPAEPVHEQF